MYRNYTNNCCCYNPFYCCYYNYCCCNPAVNACEYRYLACQGYGANIKYCSYRRISDMPSKKKSSFETIAKPKKKKKMECTCNEKHTLMCKRIQEIDKKMGRCKCMESDDKLCRCSEAPTPVVSDGKRNVEKREVYLLPYYGVPIKKNKKYILECTSFESTDASCVETPDSSNNNENDWCPRLPPECDPNEPLDTACRQRPAYPKSPPGKSNFIGRCTSLDSLSSLQLSKNNSCHCCCSRKAKNGKRHGVAPIGKSWSQLDVIDEEDMDLMDDLHQPLTKKKTKDYTSKTQGNSSKLQSPRKYDASAKANANANVNANVNANANRNSKGAVRSSGYAYGVAGSYAAPANARVSSSKRDTSGYAYGTPCCCTAANVKDFRNDTVESKTVESKMQKSLEDSCADFLNIVTDNILETVQTSVSMTLKDYCTKTTEKIDQAFEKLEQNDVAMRCLCGRLMEKLTENNERDFEKILCLLEDLKLSQQGKQNSAEKIYMESRGSQCEVMEITECPMQPKASYAHEQPPPSYYGPKMSYAKESIARQSAPPPTSYADETVTTQPTDDDPLFCCVVPHSPPESPRTSANYSGQKENLENGNGKSANGKNGNGKNANGKNGNGKNANGKNGNGNSNGNVNGKNGNGNNGNNGNEENEKAEDEIILNEVRPNESENQELVAKVIIPPCRCCHKCTCTPKPTAAAPPRPNIYLETDEKKKSISRECGGLSHQFDEEGEETMSPSGYHFVSDNCKPNANALEKKTASTSSMFTTSNLNSSATDMPASSGKDKNTHELDLYGNYDTSGYATEPEDNNDLIAGTNANNTPMKKAQFLPVTLQYIRNDTVTKTANTSRNTTNKKHGKKRTTSASKSPSSRLSRL